mgnify:CR=1 FL=1
MKRLLAPTLAAAAILLAVCAPMVTQSPGQGLSLTAALRFVGRQEGDEATFASR